jgi:hypothetical protein
MMGTIHPLILDALKKSTYVGQNEFIKIIVDNQESIFTAGILNAGEARVRNIIEGYWLGYSKPDKYTKSGDLIDKTVLFKNYNVSMNKDKQEHITNDSSIVPILIEVNKASDFIPAFKEILWHFSNKPMTSKNILHHIVKVSNTGSFEPITQKDYPVTNIQFQKAIVDFDLKLIKEKVNGKWIYLYANPTNKRKGFYLNGNLLSLKELSDINNVPIVTIQKRIAKGMPVHKAIKNKI